MTHSWSNMTVEELELQYSPSRWCKRFSSTGELIANHLEVSQKRTAEVRNKIPCRLNVQYGDKPRSQLDICGENLPHDSYIGIYVHGGYWQELNKDLSFHPVEPLYEKRIVSVIIGYTLAPESSISEIVSEVKKGIQWACQLGKQRGSKGIFLMGWSAGAQLILQALTTATHEERCLFQSILGIVTFAGVFDVRPLVKTYVNEALQLKDELSAWSESPSKNISTLAEHYSKLSALISYGQNDSNEFKRQSVEYSKNLVAAGIRSTSVEIADMDHFNLVENLNSPKYELTIQILNFIDNFIL